MALLIPFLPLALFASYLSGVGIATAWSSMLPWSPYLGQLLSAALHCGWAILAGSRRGRFAAATCVWISVYLCRAGLISLGQSSTPLLGAIVLEGIPLLLAIQLRPLPSWQDRLASWRRSRGDIAVQLRLGQGVLPWVRDCLRQALIGHAETPLSTDYQRFAASLADAEYRFRVRLSRAAMPEDLRQSILENVAAIVARAESTAAARAIELEQQ